MAHVMAYHTNSSAYPAACRKVYHDCDECHEGKRIKAEDRLTGTGDKHRCPECVNLCSSV